MPVYVAEKMIDALLEHTENFLQKAVSEWQMMEHHQFAYKVLPEKWSANQCIAHLNEYGRYYIPVIEKAIDEAIAQSQKPADHFTAGWLGNYFTNMMLTDAKGVPTKKMSAPKDYSPQKNEDSYGVIAEFIEQQEKMLQLLRKAKRVNMNKIRIPISIAKFIRLKLGDTFLFNVAHNYRHILQAERALSAITKKEAIKLERFTLKEMQS